MIDAWRLIVDSAHPGAWNMAADEAILSQVGAGASLPTLRLYAWQPACLSLGYAQPFSDVDVFCLQERGWDVVRRPTGGRAILHADELTYSISAPPSEARVAGSVLESYNRLAQGLLLSLQNLGLPVEVKEHSEKPSNRLAGPVCFEAPSAYEITVRGKKLVGSAQSRRRDGVLQHGTLPLGGDLTRITHALVFEDENTRVDAARKLLERATTLETVLGIRPSWEVAAQAFIAGFGDALNLTFERGEMSPAEVELAGRLVAEKYEHPNWTRRLLD